jgi:GNAT superfamily N-acetyltransferase
MPQEIQPDDPRCAALLAADPVGNLTITGELAHAEPEEVRVFVDRTDDPRGLLVEGSQWVKLHTAAEALDELMQAVARRSTVRFGGVAATTAALISRTHEVVSEHPAYLYYLRAADLPEERGTLPVEPLRPEHAAMVNAQWSYGDAEAYVRWRINAGPSAAVYDRGQPVSWALTQYDGQMAMMYTVPAARRRGLGMVVTLALARQLLRAGATPFLYIEHGNAAAQQHVARMGFTRHGDFRWFEARRR